VAVDAATGSIVVVDSFNNRVQKFAPLTPAAAVTPVPPCAFCAITPTSNFFPYWGSGVTGNGQVAVSVPGATAWTATSNVSWLSVVSGSSGTGNGMVTFAVAVASAATPPGTAFGAQRSGTLTIAGQTFTVTQAGPPPAATLGTVVEYYNVALDDYFISPDANEQAVVDSGAAGFWMRTGLTFRSGGAAPVYRFFGNQAINPATGQSFGPHSHFYTMWTGEQSFLQTFNPPLFNMEAPIAANGFTPSFYMTLPNPDGSCPLPLTAGAPSLLPVYRATHAGSHRLTTSKGALNEVLLRGWTNEGVAMCAPPTAAQF
jgi:hypothetical protein